MLNQTLQVMSLYIDAEIPRADLERLTRKSFETTFSHELTTPVIKLVWAAA